VVLASEPWYAAWMCTNGGTLHCSSGVTRFRERGKRYDIGCRLPVTRCMEWRELQWRPL
jgi:hypothetical protein